MKGPAGALHELLGRRLPDVVQQGGQAQPNVFRLPCAVVDHLEGVPKIVFVQMSLDFIHAGQGRHLGNQNLHGAAAKHEAQSDRGNGALQNFEQLVLNTFRRQDAQPFCGGLHALQALGLYFKVKLACEAYCAKNPQGVVAKGVNGFKGGAKDSVVEVSKPIKGVEQFAPRLPVDTNSHGIDGKIAPQLVVPKTARNHRRLAGLAAVALGTGLNKFNLPSVPSKLRRTKIGVDYYFACAKQFCRTLCKGKSITHHHKINVFGAASL